LVDGVTDAAARVRIAHRIRRVEAGNLGDVRPVGGGVSELRVHAGPGYRLYFMRRGRIVIVLLAGGDKSTQPSDIEKARRIARELEP
jgi:putative addiction module killer protein